MQAQVFETTTHFATLSGVFGAKLGGYLDGRKHPTAGHVYTP